MRMPILSPEQLAAMNAQRERCVMEIADASPDVILYACPLAVMAGSSGEHRQVESDVAEQLATGSSSALIRSSAGALVEALQALEAKRVALVTPYLRSLAEKVVHYLEEGRTVAEWRALDVADNAEVGCIPGEQVMKAARSLKLTDVDALVLSASVQMPSLPLVEAAEQEFGIPVLSAATAGAYSILRSLQLPVEIPAAGSLLRADLESVPA